MNAFQNFERGFEAVTRWSTNTKTITLASLLGRLGGLADTGDPRAQEFLDLALDYGEVMELDPELGPVTKAGLDAQSAQILPPRDMA